MAEVSERMSAAALKRLLKAFNAHDTDAVMSFFVDDCVLEMPRGPDPWGRTNGGTGPGAPRSCEQIRWDPDSTTAMTATGLLGIAAAPNGFDRDDHGG